MLGNSPVFVWLYMTAWVWASLIAYLLHRYLKANNSKISGLLFVRIAIVVFRYLAVLSAISLLVCGFGTSEGSSRTFGQNFHWLFGSSSRILWILIGLGFVTGIASEIKNYCDGDNEYGRGVFIGVFSIVGYSIALIVIMLIIAGVNSVLSSG